MSDVTDPATAAETAAPASIKAGAPEAATLPMSGVGSDGRPWRRVFQDEPIDRHGNKYFSVIVKKPLGSDCAGVSLTALNNADVGALAVVLPRVTEPMLSKSEILSRGIDDLGELAGAIIHFLLTKQVKAELGLTE